MNPALGRGSFGVHSLRSLVLVLLVPGLIFCLVNSTREAMCLDSYSWDSARGYQVNPSATCGEGVDRPTGVLPAVERVTEAGGFYLRSVYGTLTLRSGSSREDASTPLAKVLARRGLRSLAVLSIALACIGLLYGSQLLFARLAQGRMAANLQTRARGDHPKLGARLFERCLGALARLMPPGGLPLPIAGLVVFGVVLRLVPEPDHLGNAHWLDYDRAGILWAGVALSLADGAASILMRGWRHVTSTELRRSYADSLRMWGCDPTPAVAEVSRGVRAAQLRGGLLALLGGLLVVEGVFGVDGLGETLTDLVVDRQGLDALLLANVLVVFALIVLAIDKLPVEKIMGRR